ncbi:MAG TPA: HAD hydrolase-like protein, partial [Brevundimonas sp.]|nr:HAD hydrolase-like protein [Brevundimonas sp.]
ARAIMVGDAPPDVGAAKHAGLPCIVVTYGYTPIPPSDLGGDRLIDAFAQLETTIDGLIG